MHKLLELNLSWCFIWWFTTSVIIWFSKFNEFVFNINTLFKLKAIGIIQVIELFNVIILLWVLDVEYLHEEVSRVTSFWNSELKSSEIIHRFKSVTLEDCETVGHEDKSVEEKEGF